VASISCPRGTGGCETFRVRSSWRGSSGKVGLRTFAPRSIAAGETANVRVKLPASLAKRLKAQPNRGRVAVTVGVRTAGDRVVLVRRLLAVG
jgi:hypothetical protein